MENTTNYKLITIEDGQLKCIDLDTSYTTTEDEYVLIRHKNNVQTDDAPIIVSKAIAFTYNMYEIIKLCGYEVTNKKEFQYKIGKIINDELIIN